MNKEEIDVLVLRYFSYIDYGSDEYSYTYIIESPKAQSIEEAFSGLYDNLVEQGHYPLLYKVNGDLLLKISKKAQKKSRNKVVTISLFIATIVSVAFTGYLSIMAYNHVMSKLSSLGARVYGVNIVFGITLFTLAVLIPLFLHELGHYTVTSKTKTPSTFPVPIPAPVISPLGTFGALIMMHFLPKRLKDLVKLGISGPLVGVILSLIIYVASYAISPSIPRSIAEAGVSKGIISTLGVAPIGAYLVSLFLRAEQNTVRLMNPPAEAAYLILLIHFANLLPIGQLDGGHVFRALTNQRIHYITSAVTSVIAIIASFFCIYLSWLGIFVVIAWFLSGLRPHLGAANTLSQINHHDKLVYGLLYAILLLVTFPLPLG